MFVSYFKFKLQTYKHTQIISTLRLKIEILLNDSSLPDFDLINHVCSSPNSALQMLAVEVQLSLTGLLAPSMMLNTQSQSHKHRDQSTTTG